MSASADSTRVVVAALFGNLLIAISKFIAAFVTGSAATLAEAVHSVADTGNQMLLLFGLRLSKREATERHPFGRAIERYFWAFVVSIMLFTVGGVFAIVEGWHKLFAHESGAHGSSNLWNYIVLGVSFLLESYSCFVAVGEFRKLMAGRSAVRTMIEARDPTIPVVIMEDLAALVGLTLALVGVALSDLTGWPAWDGIASFLIGLLLCAVAVFLAWKTHSLIIGESATLADRVQVREIVERIEGVEGLTQLLSMHRGPEDVILALKVAFSRGLDLATVERRIDDIEARLREAMPHMRHIFIEPDSAYSPLRDDTRPSQVAAPPERPAAS